MKLWGLGEFNLSKLNWWLIVHACTFGEFQENVLIREFVSDSNSDKWTSVHY